MTSTSMRSPVRRVLSHNPAMTHDDEAPSGANAQADDAAARLLRAVATDDVLRAVLGIDARPVIDADGQRLDIDAATNAAH